MATAEQLKALIRPHFDDNNEKLKQLRFRLRRMK